MASADLSVNVLNLPQLRALVDADIALVQARNSGADAYEVRHQVEAVEKALNALGITIGAGESVHDYNAVHGWPV